jgi:hypothetical protein
VPEKVDPKESYFRIARAAKVCGISQRVLRKLADRGDIEVRWRGGERVFPVASTLAYAQRVGARQVAEEGVDALAFGMMREGRSDEAIVMELKIPLERVLALRDHRDGARPLAKAEGDPADEERSSARAVEARRRELAETREKKRAEIRRRLVG